MAPGPPLPPLSALGRAAVEHGVEKMNRRAVMRGPAGSDCEQRRRAHVAWAMRWAASWAVACELGPACYCARVGQRRGGVMAGPVGWAGWLARAEQLAERPTSPFPFFVFHFFSICLNSNLVQNLNSKLVQHIHWSFRYGPSTFLFNY